MCRDWCERRIAWQGTKVNSKGKEVPHGTRLYSIASTRYGDKYDGNTTSLCVRRATYWDPEMGKEDPAKKGLCSNFLCDGKVGDEVLMTGVIVGNMCGFSIGQRMASELCVLRSHWKGSFAS